jgi:hypothetical protein
VPAAPDTFALVPLPSIDDREYARLLIEIEIRKHRLLDLRAERDSLELALTRFAVQLKGRVGTLRAEVNRVRMQTAEYRRRIERLRENELLDPATVEAEVAEEFAERLRQAGAENGAGDRDGRMIDSARRHPRLDADTEAEILRLYRELAKRFHPDLARGEDERRRRAELMLRINVAYSERDLLTLQTIAREAETGDPALQVLSTRERLVWAHRVITRLDGQADDIQRQLDLLRRSETFQLWQSPETSQQSLASLEKRVRERLERERDRLDEAIIDYTRLVRRRRMPRTAVTS